MSKKRLEVILASQSDIRKKMLQDKKISFEVIVSDADETPDPQLHVMDSFKDIAMRKAMKVFEETQNRGKRIIIAADMNYLFCGRRYGKPSSLMEAEYFIRSTEGRYDLYAFTGNAIIYAQGKQIIKTVNTCDVARLRVDNISDKELAEYLSKPDTLKKAGGMTISDASFLHLEQGKRSTAMGMTIEHFLELYKTI